MWILREKSRASPILFGYNMGVVCNFGKFSKGFYEIMSFVSLGASGRSRHFTNFSLLSRFDSTRRKGPNIHISETND